MTGNLWVLLTGRAEERNVLFYVTLHWMLVCCGYEYLKYFLTKTGNYNFTEQCSNSPPNSDRGDSEGTEGGRGTSPVLELTGRPTVFPP